MIDFLGQIWITFVEMSPYILLGVSFVAILDLFVTKKFIVRHTNKNNLSSIIKTAFFGIPLPLCSCGVIPTSVYLEKNGASKPSVVSFLISTPQTGIDSIIATYGMLGPVFAIFRPIAALLMGILGGVVALIFCDIGKEKVEKDKENLGNTPDEPFRQNFNQRIRLSLRYAFVEFIDDISVQFIFGLVIAAAIAYFVPDDFFADFFAGNELLSMLTIMVFAIPMYVCATASIPIALSLMMKGFSPGVAYVFLVAGPVSNAATIAILSKVLGKKMLFVYILSVSITSIIFGYVLNWIFSISGIDPHEQMKHIHIHSAELSTFQLLLSYFFLILLLSSLYRKYLKRNKKSNLAVNMGEKIRKFKIDGMTCSHCAKNVERAINSIEGVENVQIALNEGTALVKGNYEVEKIKTAVESVGYTFKGEL